MTNTTKAGEAPLLKTDTLGRVHTPATRREQLLDEFERSGTSGLRFAELTGLKYQTFATWVQQRRRQRKALAPPKATRSPVDAVRWLEAVVGPPTGQGLGLPLMVQLPGGARLELTIAQHLPLAVELLRALASPSAPC